MSRKISEIYIFTREQLQALAGEAAWRYIVGAIYLGRFDGQTFEWLPDGGLKVVTEHQPEASSQWPSLRS